ncbi:hypothetical protein GQ42DRAFT_164078 [Ramicandelaber brevisporus]|nr:hypothetical protein GQ42DRAFT_164078 [Ramicandelaber brevisporus]
MTHKLKCVWILLLLLLLLLLLMLRHVSMQRHYAHKLWPDLQIQQMQQICIKRKRSTWTVNKRTS